MDGALLVGSETVETVDEILVDASSTRSLHGVAIPCYHDGPEIVPFFLSISHTSGERP